MQCVWIPVERHAQPLKLLVKNENVIYSNSIYPCPTIYIHNHLINQEHIKVCITYVFYMLQWHWQPWLIHCRHNIQIRVLVVVFPLVNQ